MEFGEYIPRNCWMGESVGSFHLGYDNWFCSSHFRRKEKSLIVFWNTTQETTLYSFFVIFQFQSTTTQIHKENRNLLTILCFDHPTEVQKLLILTRSKNYELSLR